jgi:hypothetical protein
MVVLHRAPTCSNVIARITECKFQHCGVIIVIILDLARVLSANLYRPVNVDDGYNANEVANLSIDGYTDALLYSNAS